MFLKKASKQIDDKAVSDFPACSISWFDPNDFFILCYLNYRVLIELFLSNQDLEKNPFQMAANILRRIQQIGV